MPRLVYRLTVRSLSPLLVLDIRPMSDAVPMEIDTSESKASTSERKYDADRKADDEEEIEPSPAKKQKTVVEPPSSPSTAGHPDSYHVTPVRVARRNAIHSAINEEYRAQGTSGGIPLDVSNLIAEMSFGDAYASDNRNFPSLIKRRDEIHEVISIGRPWMSLRIAALISEYGLLPPSVREECKEEKERGPSINFWDSLGCPVSFDESDDHRELESVSFRWKRDSNLLALNCSLTLYKSWALNTKLMSLFDGEDTVLDSLRDRYCGEEGDPNLDPDDIRNYPFKEDPNMPVLERASMSFYYREFMAGYCQCEKPDCAGSDRLDAVMVERPPMNMDTT